MDVKENERMDQENFDLEDILKEFQEESDVPEAQETPEEDVRVWNGGKTDVNPSVPADTVRLDDVARLAREQTQSQTQTTVRFAPVEEDVTVYNPPVSPQPTKVEPFSEQWEPEYEEPMGEYIPPEPIIFRPKSRLRELKKKLVEGPERRFYELEEQGVGKLQTAIFLSLLVSIVAVVGVVLFETGFVSPERTRLLIFSQMLMLMLSALLGSYQIIAGVTDVLRLRFSLNTLLVFSLLAGLVDGVLCLQHLRVPCCATFCIHMTMSLWSTYQKRTTEMSQMDTMRKATRLDSLVLSEDYLEGRPGYLRGEGQVEDFMDFYDEPSGPEKVLSWYAIIALVLSIAVGVAGWSMYSMAVGLRLFSTSLLVAVPVSAHVALSRPAALLQRRLRKHGSVICGWQGVRGLCRPAVFPLTDADLFPAGSAKLNGVKFYSSRNPDEVVAYAAAVICADGGSMATLMSQLLESRSGYHYDVTELRGYNGGIGGVVNNEAVLAGTLTFMQDMGVDMPKGTKVNQAVYVAIDGELCGVFAVTFAKTKSASVGLTTLCAYRRLTPVMVTGDFMLTDSFLHGKFGVNTRRIVFPPRNIRMELAQKQADPDIVALALTTKEGLAGMAYAVTGSRALRACSIVGTVVHILGGSLGILIVAALMLVNADALLSPGNILLYQLVWAVPGLLITEWTRSV